MASAAGGDISRGAKGDVILLGNQVGDNSPLYWNGRTYVWEDSQKISDSSLQ